MADTNSETSELIRYAEREFDLMGDNSEPGKWMRRAVMSWVQVFDESGYKGFSAKDAIEMFRRLVLCLPITPLTGDDGEWTEVADDLWQNNRCSSVFKNDKGEAWDIFGKVFREPNGSGYTTSDSHTPVTFPYTPTTVYVDVEPRQYDGPQEKK